ncbi:MAG: cytochrome P450 [Myxococcota bacterium]
MTEKTKLDGIDFALNEMPGDEMHRILRAYREKNPISETLFLGLPARVITGYPELLDALMDSQGFPPHAMYKASFENAIGETFISMEDPQRHRLYRKLVTPAFRSRAIANYEQEGIAALAHELVDRLHDQESFDLVTAFTTRFPYLVISRLLGLPKDREDEFQEWALALLRFRDDPAAAQIAGRKLTDFLSPVVEDRRRHPKEDVISELLEIEIEGRKLSEEEIHSHIRLLFPTGGETTHGSIGNLLYAVLSDPSLWQILCEDPSLADAASEESLRWETPIAVLPRLSGETDQTFHGVEIPANSWVLFAMAAANRDPRVFDQPDRFDLTRQKNESLTFGRGVKACPGTHLARKNMTVALQVLIERMPSLHLIDHEAALPRQTVLRCPKALHVSV